MSKKAIKKNNDKFYNKLLQDYDNISIDDVKSKLSGRVLESKKEDDPEVRPKLEPKYIYAPELEDFYLDIPI